MAKRDLCGELSQRRRSARVTPGESRPISSWIHEHLAAGATELAQTFTENWPRDIHCVSPAVTLLEKVEAIGRHYRRDPFEPARFVRHYEDAAQILKKAGLTAPADLGPLLAEVRGEGDIKNWPSADDPAFNPEADPVRWSELEGAWSAIQPMFWGERIPLEECAGALRETLRALG